MRGQSFSIGVLGLFCEEGQGKRGQLWTGAVMDRERSNKVDNRAGQRATAAK